MAEETTAPATQPPPAANEASTDLAVLGEVTAVAERPKSLERGNLAGTEDIGPNDVRLPRLATAQSTSYEMLPGDSRHIPDLKLFDMFNDLTSEVYGRGPITFIPIRRDVRRIKFRPRTEGGGILEMDVPANDPSLKWTVENGERKPPATTTFIEFVILMLRPGKAPEPIVLSIKGTNKFNRRAADQLTTFIKLRNAPIYAGMYTVTGGQEKNDKGTFGVPVIKNAGFIPKDTPAGAALYRYAKEFHESLEGKSIVVEREPGDEDEFEGDGADAPPANANTDGM